MTLAFLGGGTGPGRSRHRGRARRRRTGGFVERRSQEPAADILDVAHRVAKALPQRPAQRASARHLVRGRVEDVRLAGHGVEHSLHRVVVGPHHGSLVEPHQHRPRTRAIFEAHSKVAEVVHRPRPAAATELRDQEGLPDTDAVLGGEVAERARYFQSMSALAGDRLGGDLAGLELIANEVHIVEQLPAGKHLAVLRVDRLAGGVPCRLRHRPILQPQHRAVVGERARIHHLLRGHSERGFGVGDEQVDDGGIVLCQRLEAVHQLRCQLGAVGQRRVEHDRRLVDEHPVEVGEERSDALGLAHFHPIKHRQGAVGIDRGAEACRHLPPVLDATAGVECRGARLGWRERRQRGTEGRLARLGGFTTQLGAGLNVQHSLNELGGKTLFLDGLSHRYSR